MVLCKSGRNSLLLCVSLYVCVLCVSLSSPSSWSPSPFSSHTGVWGPLHGQSKGKFYSLPQYHTPHTNRWSSLHDHRHTHTHTYTSLSHLPALLANQPCPGASHPYGQPSGQPHATIVSSSRMGSRKEERGKERRLRKRRHGNQVRKVLALSLSLSPFLTHRHHTHTIFFSRGVRGPEQNHTDRQTHIYIYIVTHRHWGE